MNRLIKFDWFNQLDRFKYIPDSQIKLSNSVNIKVKVDWFYSTLTFMLTEFDNLI